MFHVTLIVSTWIITKSGNFFSQAENIFNILSYFYTALETINKRYTFSKRSDIYNEEIDNHLWISK